jgi:hypothetical protein
MEAGEEGLSPTTLLETLRGEGGGDGGDDDGVVWDEEIVLGAVGVLANLGAVLLVDDFDKPRIVTVAKGTG